MNLNAMTYSTCSLSRVDFDKPIRIKGRFETVEVVNKDFHRSAIVSIVDDHCIKGLWAVDKHGIAIRWGEDIENYDPDTMCEYCGECHGNHSEGCSNPEIQTAEIAA